MISLCGFSTPKGGSNFSTAAVIIPLWFNCSQGQITCRYWNVIETCHGRNREGESERVQRASLPAGFCSLNARTDDDVKPSHVLSVLKEPDLIKSVSQLLNGAFLLFFCYLGMQGDVSLHLNSIFFFNI